MIFLLTNKLERLTWTAIPQEYDRLLLPGFAAYFAENEQARFFVQQTNIDGNLLHIIRISPNTHYQFQISTVKKFLGLTYIRKGRFQILSPVQQDIAIEDSSFAYYPAGYSMKVCIPNELEIFVLECKAEIVRRLSGIAPILSPYVAAYMKNEKQALVSSRYTASFGLRMIFEEMRNAVFKEKAAGLFHIHQMSNLLLGKLFRQVKNFAQINREGNRGKVQILSVQHYIQSQIDKKLSIEELSARFYFCERTLRRNFQKIVGMGLWQYIAQEKIKRAKMLLETTSMGVDQISYKLSYANPTALNKAFKRITGYTPTEYKIEILTKSVRLR